MKKDRNNSTKEIEKALSSVESDFVNCARLQQGSKEQLELAYEWNKKVNRFFERYPQLSVADIAKGLEQLDVPYNTAMKDVAVI